MTRPVLVTVLPKPRMARHPYQLCMMLALITIAVSQLTIGPPPNASVHALHQSDQNMLNWFCIWGGLAGIAAAVIPERVFRMLDYSLDLTWLRLWVELACHGLLFFVWTSYLVAISMVVPFTQGLALESGLAFWLTVAAIWRGIQIGLTIKRAISDPPETSGVIGADDLPDT